MDWAAHNESRGEWSEAVTRSLITLKALTYAPTGGIVAAPTTSLPEKLGGVRNWDYRFCWLRDSTLTLLALMNAGYYDEAQAWRDWLLRAAAGSPSQLQIMYGLAGERRLPEYEVPWLPGYERQHRFGSATRRMDNCSSTSSEKSSTRSFRANAAGWTRVRPIGPSCARSSNTWSRCGAVPDRGHLGNTRRRPALHLSRKSCRGSRSIAASARSKSTRSRARSRAGARSVNASTPRSARADSTASSGVSSSRTDSKNLDASLLLIPTTGFLPATDPRVRGTIEAVERHLFVDGFVRRYDTHTTDDGLPPGEGAFLACSFWLVDALLLSGRADDARQLFERLLGLRNDVGLLAEEYDTETKRLVGNFPQAFSHIALVNSAHNLGHAVEACRAAIVKGQWREGRYGLRLGPSDLDRRTCTFGPSVLDLRTPPHRPSDRAHSIQVVLSRFESHLNPI